MRDHPLMRHGGVPNWPPVWTTTRLENKPKPTGEVGFLEDVVMNDLHVNKIFLVLLHEGNSYLGSLIFDDAAFCQQIFALLKLNRSKRTKEIGDLDISHTL